MLAVIAEIDRYVSEHVAALWPASGLSTSFVPSVNLHHGDVSSDVLIQLSGQRKEAPEPLAERLLERLNHPAFSVERGFLNYRGEDSSKWFLSAEVPAAPASPLFFSLPGGGKNIAFDGYARLAGACSFQMLEALKTGHQVTIGYADGSFGSVTVETLPSIFERLMDQCSAASELSRILFTRERGRTTVWTLTHQLSKSGLDWLLRHELRSLGLLSVVIPPRAWGVDSPSGFTREWFLRLLRDRAALPSLLHCLASGDQYADLDPYAVSFQEQANLWWFLQSTLERLEVHGCAGEARDKWDGGELSPLERRLLIRLKYIETFRLRAVREGEVFNYITVLQDLLVSFNQLFNQPGFRSLLNAGGLSGVQKQILSGMSTVLRVLLKH